jgi:hypothetical protein
MRSVANEFIVSIENAITRRCIDHKARPPSFRTHCAVSNSNKKSIALGSFDALHDLTIRTTDLTKGRKNWLERYTSYFLR